MFSKSPILWHILCSVVTVSKISPSVSFGRFCKKNRGFLFGFCLSRFPPVVNVVCLCGPLHIKPAAVRYIFLCITPVDSSTYPTAWDWWREKPPPVPNVIRVAKRYLSGSLRHRHPLLVSICTARHQACSQTDVTGWVQKKLMLLFIKHNLPLISFKY